MRRSWLIFCHTLQFSNAYTGSVHNHELEDGTNAFCEGLHSSSANTESKNQNISTYKIASFHFLDENLILLALLRTTAEKDPHFVLSIYNFGSTTPDNSGEPEPIVTYALPRMAPYTKPEYMGYPLRLYSNLILLDQSINQQVPFSTSPQDGIITMSIILPGDPISSETPNETCVIDAQTSTLLAERSSKYISWSDWASSARLIFPWKLFDHHSETIQARGVKLCNPYDTEEGNLTVFDFSRNSKRFPGVGKGGRDNRDCVDAKCELS